MKYMVRKKVSLEEYVISFIFFQMKVDFFFFLIWEEVKSLSHCYVFFHGE